MFIAFEYDFADFATFVFNYTKNNCGRTSTFITKNFRLHPRIPKAFVQIEFSNGPFVRLDHRFVEKLTSFGFNRFDELSTGKFIIPLKSNLSNARFCSNAKSKDNGSGIRLYRIQENTDVVHGAGCHEIADGFVHGTGVILRPNLHLKVFTNKRFTNSTGTFNRDPDFRNTLTRRVNLSR